jgi:peptidoglycan L-alanyl-D-glutamate endopeptidase CwlK
MASRLISDLHPLIIPMCNAFAKKMRTSGIQFIVTCTYRSPEEQNSLFAQGRTFKAGVWTVTNSKMVVTWVQAGNSAHNVKKDGKPAAMAFDIVVITDGKLNWDSRHKYWMFAIQHGTDCGLRNLYPKEAAHFEIQNWKKIIAENKK